VAAARKAGFAQAIIHQAPGGSKLEQKEDPELAPDQYIGNLKELLDIFPERLSPQPLKVYNASLSTMWAQKNFPALNDFFEFARRAGFASIELNHKINSKMLADVDLSQYPIRSIHEPCPADISVETLKSEDWLVSALDEENRRKGVAAIRRSIDIAHQLGVAAIVVHVGHTELDLELEKQLRSLYDSGLKGSEDYQALQERMMKKRSELAAPGLAAVKKSLGELLAYAKPYGIRLGLENRYHFMEYPSPDELGILLEMAGPEQLGFIFDVGHAQHLSRLGFYPHDEWLKRFSARIIGTHLHDVIGLQDHYTPGRGNVDYDEIAAYLPENAFRTCEFMESNSPDQIKAGLRYLAQKRCVTIL
jgi:sugar phosphate isomerase/epimerase